MKKILLFLAAFGTIAAYAADTAAPTAAPQPSDQASLAYMQAAQQGTAHVAGEPGGGRYAPPLPADPKLPTLWIIGDSTVRNGTPGNGSTNAPDGQWGWGAPLTYYFNIKKINVVNRAFGGTTAPSFYNGFFWKNMQPQIKKGDFVILQFGANDSSRSDLDGTGDEVSNGLHTFGWYLKQFVLETRAQGGTCIICSLTPRKNWSADGKMHDVNNHVDWAAQAAAEIGAPYINLHELIQLQYDKLGKDKVDLLYVPTPAEAAAQGGSTRAEGLHTGWDGAVVNAECVVSGIKSLKDTDLASFLNSRGDAVPAAPTDCVAENPTPTPPAAAK